MCYIWQCLQCELSSKTFVLQILENAVSSPKGNKLNTCHSQMSKEVVHFISKFYFLCLCGWGNQTIAVIGAQLEVLKFSDVLVVVGLNCKLCLCSVQTVN